MTGTFLTVQAAAREMINRKIKGSIAIVASMSGTVSNQGMSFLFPLLPSDLLALPLFSST